MIRLNDPSTVGTTLRQLRENGGYEPADVTSLVVLPPRTVERIESGYLPNLAELTLMAMVYGYDVALVPQEDREVCSCDAGPAGHVRCYRCEVAAGAGEGV